MSDEMTVPKSPPKYMFWLSRIFGKRISPYAFYWRGQYWLTSTPSIIDLSEQWLAENPEFAEKCEMGE
jgi:hypothetical protein